MRHVALQVIIDRNVTAFGLNPSSSQIERIYIPRPASRKEDRAYVEAVGTPLLAIVQSNTAIAFFQALSLGSSDNGHPLLIEGICEGERNILIFLGNKSRGKLKQVYLATEI